MPLYEIPVTRDVTVTATVKVAALDLTAAQDHALNVARYAMDLNWELDDCVNGEIYIADPDSGEEVDA
jgi:hypothetical protein